MAPWINVCYVIGVCVRVEDRTLLNVHLISDEEIHRKRNDEAGKEMKPLFLSPRSLPIRRDFVTRSHQTGKHYHGSVVADKITKASDCMGRHAKIFPKGFWYWCDNGTFKGISHGIFIWTEYYLVVATGIPWWEVKAENWAPTFVHESNVLEVCLWTK